MTSVPMVPVESKKESKAKQLMIGCSGQWPDCLTISNSEIMMIMDNTKDAKNAKSVGDLKGTSAGDKDVSDGSTDTGADAETMITDMILVDVRSKEERDVSMLPGSITSEEFESLIKTNPDQHKSKLIVPYCTIGYRSGKYASNLKKQYGFENVRNGEGIILSTYVCSNLVRKEGGMEVSTNEVHTFGSDWDLASENYSTVQFGMVSYIKNGVAALLK